MDIAIDTAGLHPSTEACLEALQWLHEREEAANILDMGCGNGILSLVSASIWDASALAVDISPKAVADTQKNIEIYELEEQVTALRNDGFRHPVIKARAPYDLILFNMLAEIAVDMASDIKLLLKPGGYCLLAGILAWKASPTRRLFSDLGFESVHEIVRMPWHAYVLCHKS